MKSPTPKKETMKTLKSEIDKILDAVYEHKIYEVDAYNKLLKLIQTYVERELIAPVGKLYDYWESEENPVPSEVVEDVKTEQRQALKRI